MSRLISIKSQRSYSFFSFKGEIENIFNYLYTNNHTDLLRKNAQTKIKIIYVRNIIYLFIL